jgi:Zn-dependent membrane protease YugP
MQVYFLTVVIPSLIIALWAQAKVRSAMSKYNRVASGRGYTGAQAAQEILTRSGISDVEITTTRGILGDHYDPVNKVLRLTPGVFNSSSITAVGIAAHEAGHALQQAHAYAPLSLRTAIVPMAAMSNLAWPVLILGIILHFTPLITAAIVLFFGLVLLQLVNLPVEYNASRRAREALLQFGIADRNEIMGVNEVLSAAALTYVAAALGSILQLLYLIGLRRS